MTTEYTQIQRYATGGISRQGSRSRAGPKGEGGLSSKQTRKTRETRRGRDLLWQTYSRDAGQTSTKSELEICKARQTDRKSGQSILSNNVNNYE